MKSCLILALLLFTQMTQAREFDLVAKNATLSYNNSFTFLSRSVEPETKLHLLVYIGSWEVDENLYPVYTKSFHEGYVSDLQPIGDSSDYSAMTTFVISGQQLVDAYEAARKEAKARGLSGHLGLNFTTYANDKDHFLAYWAKDMRSFLSELEEQLKRNTNFFLTVEDKLWSRYEPRSQGHLSVVVFDNRAVNTPAKTPF